MVHNAPKSTGKAKNTKDRRRRIGKRKSGGKNWLKNGNPPGDPRNAPRCGAKTRSGKPCQAPGMANGRCRMHGGASTGPRTPEGLEDSRVLAGNMAVILPLKSKAGDEAKFG